MRRISISPLIYPDVVEPGEKYTVAFQVENESFIPVAPVFCRLRRGEEVYWQFGYFGVFKRVVVFKFELEAKEEEKEKLIAEAGFTPVNLIASSELEVKVK